MINQNRVCCLYRVSTDKQVDYTNNNEVDIPMQRKTCHRFAEKMGYKLNVEFNFDLNQFLHGLDISA